MSYSFIPNQHIPTHLVKLRSLVISNLLNWNRFQSPLPEYFCFSLKERKEKKAY